MPETRSVSAAAGSIQQQMTTQEMDHKPFMKYSQEGKLY